MMPINMNGCRRAFQSPLAAHGLRSALAICLLALLLGACAQTAPRPDAAPAVSVMVVPSSSDGHVGAVTVRPLKGGKKVLLDQPFVSATVAGDGSVQTAKVDPKQAKEDFAAARAALPKAPTTLLVFFVEGTDTLQPEARRTIDRVAVEIAGRRAPEVTVIGHTDYVGSHEYNDKLSLQRAEKVRDQLVARGISAAIIQVAGRGKREPMVDTTAAERRNRRVEITIR
jgi:OmpA-OmpF porin, OOP family